MPRSLRVAQPPSRSYDPGRLRVASTLGPGPPTVPRNSGGAGDAGGAQPLPVGYENGRRADKDCGGPGMSRSRFTSSRRLGLGASPLIPWPV
jgi:hypothetical protein